MVATGEEERVVNFDPTRPIYLQIIEEVKKRAVRGDYAAGEQLPSVRDMAAQMGVNPNTMSRAYQELEREGFVHTKRGEGSFLTHENVRIESERTGLAQAACSQFVVQLRDLGLDTATTRHLLQRVEEKVNENGDR
jgi:GntR family transcriptional regulator